MLTSDQEKKLKQALGLRTSNAAGLGSSNATGISLNPKEKIDKIIEEQLGRPVSSSSDRFVEDLGADSLDLVELVMAFEEEFKDQMGGAEIPESEAEKLTTVGAVIDYIKSKSA